MLNHNPVCLCKVVSLREDTVRNVDIEERNERPANFPGSCVITLANRDGGDLPLALQVLPKDIPILEVLRKLTHPDCPRVTGQCFRILLPFPEERMRKRNVRKNQGKSKLNARDNKVK